MAESPNLLEVSSSYRFTYRRVLDNKNEIFFHGKQNLGEYLSISSGVSTAFNSFPESFFLNLNINNFPSFLRYSISFLSRDFPDYEMKENSIYPTISLLTKYIEFEMGISFRSIGSDLQGNTTHTLYRLQFNILDKDYYGLRFRISNFNLYRAGNISELYYILENSLKLKDKLFLTADIGFHNSGQLAFSSYYSSFFGQIGVKYRL